MGGMDDLYELGSREKELPAPPHVVWEALTQPRRPEGRPWLSLASDETEPRILDSEEARLVVWSSPWRDRPDDVVRLAVRNASHGSLLRYTWLSPEPLVEAEELGQGRHRLNEIFFRDLRLSWGA